jgi:tripartite-type tricarboxylate transporter receptor subunit TctC
MMLSTKTGPRAAAAFAVLALLCGPAMAQNFPNGPVKFLVPVPAGGVTDTMARIVGTRLSEMWGQPVIVENRPGGNYAVASQAVARAPADGYTLLVAPDSTFTANPFLIANLSYNIKEFTAISGLCRGTPMLAVNAALPVKDVKELIALAKAKPGTLNYGSYGVGTYAHLSMEDFKQRTGTDVQHIPYRGAAPATNDLLSGQINMVLLNLSSVADHEKTGKVKILASAGEKRAEARPDLPKVAEAGVPGFATNVWFGLLGPANMPADLVAKIHADVQKVLAMPQTKEFFEKNSFERMDLSPKQFGELIERDSKHWSALIKSVGAKID